MPDEPEAVGLLALMLLEQARSQARSTPEGKLIPLPEQDRSRWNRGLIQEGQELVRRCLRRNQPGPYQIQAAINAVHSDAPTAAQTDWSQILALYDQLLAITPTPVVALNRAVAVAEIDGPQVALELIDELPLEHYYLFHAIRADLLRRLGHADQAEAAYRAAIERTGNAAEIAFMKEPGSQQSELRHVMRTHPRCARHHHRPQPQRHQNPPQPQPARPRRVNPGPPGDRFPRPAQRGRGARPAAPRRPAWPRLVLYCWRYRGGVVMELTGLVFPVVRSGPRAAW